MPTPAYLKSWAIFTVIATLVGLLIGGLVGGIIGAILGAAGVSLKVIPLITGLVGFLLGLPISFLTFRWSVNKYILQPLQRNEPPVISG